MDKHLVQAIQHLSLALTKHKVDYMFVGGVAIAFYAQPRASSNLPKGIDYDVDIWYRATSRNFVQLSEAILEISPELESDLKKITFDAKKTFLKFNWQKIHFDFLPELFAFH